jgi:hypothetical protein
MITSFRAQFRIPGSQYGEDRFLYYHHLMSVDKQSLINIWTDIQSCMQALLLAECSRHSERSVLLGLSQGKEHFVCALGFRFTFVCALAFRFTFVCALAFRFTFVCALAFRFTSDLTFYLLFLRLPLGHVHIRGLNVMFVDPCIIVQFLKKNPTRCNSVPKFYYSIFI